MLRDVTIPPRNADAVDREVGRRIAARRLSLGLSQTALAQRSGVSFQQIQKYESGLNRVSASRLHRIALALGTPVGDFFPETTQMTHAEPPPPDLMRHPEGRLLAACFPRIADRRVRRALSRLAVALAQPG